MCALRSFFEVAELEKNFDPDQIDELEARIKTFGLIDDAEVQSFAKTFYKGLLDTQGRIKLEV